MQNYNNQLDIKYTLSDGRVFEAKRGKLDQFSYKKNGYDQHGFHLEFDWGLHTSMFYEADTSMPDVLGRFILEIMGVVGGASDQLTGRPMYILFQEERRNIPLGLVSLDGYSFIIFNDFFGWD